MLNFRAPNAGAPAKQLTGEDVDHCDRDYTGQDRADPEGEDRRPKDHEE
jgi:hypothetical protein